MIVDTKMTTKRPLALTAIASMQIVFAFAACLTMMLGDFSEWFAVWGCFNGVLHGLSGAATLRLNWAGPALCALALVGAFIVGHVFMPSAAQPGIAATILWLAVVSAYFIVIYMHRELFSPRFFSRHRAK